MKEAFIISIMIGVTVGAIAGYYGSMLYDTLGDKFFFDKNSLAVIVVDPVFFDKDVFVLSLATPLLVLALSFILQRRFPSAWREVDWRMFCVVPMLLMYMFGVILGMVYYKPILGEFAFIPLYIPFVAYFSLPLAMITFVNSNIVAIAAAYIVTKGIEPLYKRITVALVMTFLIYIAAAFPLGTHGMLSV
jgi:hypothetical protein